MKLQGRIQSVFNEMIGDTLVEDAPAGSASILMSEAGAFQGYVTKEAIIDEETYVLTATSDEKVFLVDPPLLSDAAAGEIVTMSPIIFDKKALVAVDEQGGEGGDVLEVALDHSLKSMLAEGNREPLKGEWVIMDDDFGEMTMRQIVQENYGVLGEAISSPIPQEYLTDGEPPTEVPDFEIIQFFGSVYIKVTPILNPDPITGYNVYVNGVLAVNSPSTIINVAVDGAGVQLPYSTDSSFRVSAVDGDGNGPISAAKTGRPYKVDSADIAQGIIDSIDAAGEAANQAAADAAQAAADALEAAGLAAGKGKVIPKTTAPVGDDRNVNNLWIDISGSPAKNTPNRWDGSNWVPITDKVAVDAASAAATASTNAAAASAAATTALTAANGKNKNTFSAAELPPTTTGRVPGDVHNQIVEGVSIKEWVLDDLGSWQEQKISGARFTNLDASTMTVGLLDVALLIEAGAISAELIGAGAITSDVSWTGLQTIGPVNGRHIVIDPSVGLTLFGPDGTTPVIHLSLTEASSLLSGQVNADTVSILKGIELIGNMSKILSGGGLTVDAGVGDPSVAPQLTQGPIVTGGFPGPVNGWQIKGVSWSSADNRFHRIYWNPTTKSISVWAINDVGGDRSTVMVTNDGLDAVTDVSGVVKVGNLFYMNVLETFSNGVKYWRLYSYTAAGVRQANLPTFAANSSTPVWAEYVSRGFPGIGKDQSGNILIVCSMTGATSGNRVVIWRFRTSDMDLLSRTKITNITTAINFRNVEHGDFDFGSGASVLTFAGASNVWATSNGYDFPAEATTADSRAWTVDSPVPNEGVTWKSSGNGQGYFYSFAGDTFQRRWSTYLGAGTEKWWARYINRNISSGKVTGPSPVSAGMELKNRWWPSVALDALPSGTDASYVHVGYAMLPPTQFYRRSESIGSNRSMLMNLLKNTSGTTSMPANTFGTGASAWIKSALQPGWTLNGDGTAVFRTPQNVDEPATKGYVDKMSSVYGLITRSAVMSLANGAETLVTYTAANVNAAITGGGVVANTNGLVVPESGFYLILPIASFAAAPATGSRIPVVKVNGVSAVSNSIPLHAGNSGYPVPVFLYLNAGDGITYSLYQSSGSPINTHNQAQAGISLAKVG